MYDDDGDAVFFPSIHTLFLKGFSIKTEHKRMMDEGEQVCKS